MTEKLINDIYNILDNVYYWESCPQEYNDKIDVIKKELETELKKLRVGAVSCWVAFDWNKIETRPTAYGKYLICRKDGKIHWETWNGSGLAYNHNESRFWAVIVPPCS